MASNWSVAEKFPVTTTDTAGVVPGSANDRQLVDGEQDPFELAAVMLPAVMLVIVTLIGPLVKAEARTLSEIMPIDAVDGKIHIPALVVEDAGEPAGYKIPWTDTNVVLSADTSN